MDYIPCLSDINPTFDAMPEIIAPQGSRCAIVGNMASLPMEKLFGKSARFVWEITFTRSMFETADMVERLRLLNEVAHLVDDGKIEPR